jgi:DNA-binding response OmpR family regulator
MTQIVLVIEHPQGERPRIEQLLTFAGFRVDAADRGTARAAAKAAEPEGGAAAHPSDVVWVASMHPEDAAPDLSRNAAGEAPLDGAVFVH